MNNTFVDNLVKIATTNSVSGDASDIDMDALQSSAIAAGTADPRLVAQFAASPNVLQVAPQNLYATTPNYLPYTVGSGVAAGTLLASRTVRNGVAAGLPFGLKNRQLYDALLGNTGSSATSPLMRQIFGGSRDAAGKVSFTARTAPTDIEKYLTGLREGTSFSTGIELRPYGYGGKSMAEWNTPASGRWITKPFRLASKPVFWISPRLSGILEYPRPVGISRLTRRSVVILR